MNQINVEMRTRSFENKEEEECQESEGKVEIV